jgi:stearoyl-CoA desaturase (delta-9 desaturase)
VRQNDPAFPITVASVTFVLMHGAALMVFLLPFRAALAWMALGLYALRMFGVTAGYHRYFSHRAYRLGRVSQFLMACLAQSSGQKGVLWWTAHHREHHRHADQPEDVHSPVQESFWWSHVGWVLSDRYDAYDPKSVKDLGKFPELRWLDRFHFLPALALALLVAAWGARSGAGILSALAWWALSTVALYHATFCINSLAHIWGTRRFATPDHSRNNLLLALLTFGEGWHNNHHAFPGACRQGLRWWEIDLTQGGLRVLALLGIARELRPHPKGGPS